MNRPPSSSSAACFITLICCSSTALPAQGTWSQTPITGTAPLRAGHAAAYDMARQRLVAFGGFDPSYATQAGTFEFDGVNWTEISLASGPSARAGHAMAYDLTRGRVVLFGGRESIISAPLADTWEFDGVTWTQRFPAHSPVGRADHALAFDAVSGATLMFGGEAAGQTTCGDTWLWNGVDWQQVATTGPAPRRNHALSCDWSRGCVVMFGGFETSAFDETWEWDGGHWSEVVSASTPSARSDHGMAFDFARGVTVMHGGTQGGAETWEWDGVDWIQSGSGSVSKFDHVIVFDARLLRTTLYGGAEVGTWVFRSDVESYGPEVPGSFEVRGSSCAGSASTPQLHAPTSLASGPRIGESPVVQIHNSWFHSFFVFGWSDTADNGTALPYDLGAYGMPGCSLQVSRDGLASVSPNNGIATLAMPIPNDPFLVGVGYFIQGLVLDPGANVGGYTTTNRIMATIGRS